MNRLALVSLLLFLACGSESLPEIPKSAPADEAPPLSSPDRTGEGPALYDVQGDGGTLILRGRGLAQAEVTLEQDESIVELEILSADEYELHAALPTAMLDRSAWLLVRAKGELFRQRIALLRGPSGAAGPSGEKGEAGPAGPKGEKGDDGEMGPPGPQGERGEQGPQGPRGEKGDQGPRGLAGAPGTAGPTGPRGERGEKGAAGPKGDKGDPGIAGLDVLEPSNSTTAQYLTSASWTQVGSTRYVTVGEPTNLVFLLDLLVPSSSYGDVRFAISVDGALVGSGVLVPAGMSRNAYLSKSNVSPGLRAIRLHAKPEGLAGTLIPDHQQILVIQAR